MEQNKPKIRVLVVDDHETIADSLALILNQNGCTATAVYSGEQAVDAARRIKPDVLISDVIMNGMSGIEAAILISTALPDCEILLISGNQKTGDLLAHAHRDGHAFEVLAKPVHPDVILHRVHDFSESAS